MEEREIEASPIRVAVVGAAGRMGREVLMAVHAADGLELVSAVDREHSGVNAREFGSKFPDLTIQPKLGAALDAAPADVLVDFSHASSAPGHAQSALKRGVSPVLGVTGMSDGDLRELGLQCRELGVPAMYVPNFAIGAVLMMRFAEIAARWMPDAEIIELHHDRKEDAPSGTAMRTAELIQRGRTGPAPSKPVPALKVPGARGANFQDVHIHSVRLRGLVAHQQVMFGGHGEVLTLRHDSMDRASFMEGVKLAVRSVRLLQGLTVGLESLLFD